MKRRRSLLAPGGTVGIVAPAGGVPAPAWIEAARRYFAARGHDVKALQPLDRCDRYLAGDDGARAAALAAAFADDSVAAILALRGGYGSGRLLDRLDWDAIAAHPKPLIGFSDVTALQLALLARARMVSYSGLNCVPDLRDGELPALTERTLWLALRGEPYSLGGLTVERVGVASGPIVGGCLSLLVSLLGTPFAPDFTDAILSIEDVNEEPYRIDRMLNHLRLAGVFSRVAGVAIGRFNRCEAKNPEDGDVARVLREIADWVNGPVVSNLPYGHIPDRCVLPIGAPVELAAPADGAGTLRIAGI